MDETTTIDLPSTECALVTSNHMEGLHFTFPNPEHQDLANYAVPEPMAYLAACYYRYFRDPEFVRQQMDWCENLEIGRSFVEIHGKWWIVLSAAETKENRADERPVKLMSCSHLSLTATLSDSDRSWRDPTTHPRPSCSPQTTAPR
jgi:hypothetical protein